MAKIRWTLSAFYWIYELKKAEDIFLWILVVSYEFLLLINKILSNFCEIQKLYVLLCIPKGWGTRIC